MQLVGESAPGLAEYVPAVQLLQKEEEVDVLYLPASHSMQTVAAGAGVYLPAEQGLQAFPEVARLEVEKVPGTHS